MKRIQYAKYGGPELMKLVDFVPVVPGKGEVAVKVKFAAINPIDWKVRNGYLSMVTGKSFPRAMGSDFSGTVIAVGADVTRFKPGEAVFGMARLKESGALGQIVVTDESFMALKPENVSFEDAACLATPGVTAWNGLVDKAKLVGGKQVFINGCAGAVGEAAVQIAQMLGADIAGSCRESDIDRVKALSVRAAYDYRSTDLQNLGRRFDVVYDTAAVMTPRMGTGLLNKGGAYLDINPTPARFIRSLFDRQLKPIVCTPRAEILDALARAAGSGKLRLPVATIVPLRDAVGLIAALEQGRRLGGKGLVAME
jgi:NADPH:quinone reductase-like Zn-dependent oxidoreductase